MSVKIDREKLYSGLLNTPLDKTWCYGLFGGFLRPFMVYLNTIKTYADKGILGRYTSCRGVSTGGAYLRARDRKPYWVEGVSTAYWTELAEAQSTSDHRLWKTVNGTNTTLGSESVDLDPDSPFNRIFLYCVGTSIRSRRTKDDAWNFGVDVPLASGATEISVTDTDIASGALGAANINERYTPGTYWGAVSYWGNAWVLPESLVIRDLTAGSPLPAPPKPLAYFEVPIEFYDLPEFNDDGTVNLTRKFYGVKMPEEIVEVEKPMPQPRKLFERKIEILKAKGWTTEEIKAFMPEAFPTQKINRLAVTWSALIPTRKGKPKNSTAILRVFGGSPEYVHPIEKRIQAIKEMRGVRQLKREEAINLALKMDDKLHIHDLVPCRKHPLGGKCFREYRDGRIHTIGDKPEFADTDIRKHYVKAEKGW